MWPLVSVLSRCKAPGLDSAIIANNQTQGGSVLNKRTSPKTLIYLFTITLLLFGSLVLAGDLTRTTLKVENLYCGACLTHIDAALKEVAGVDGMRGDLAQGIVQVDHTATLAGEKIADTITALGYPATIVSQTNITAQNSFSSQPQANTASSCCGVSRQQYSCGGSGAQRYGCSASSSAWKKLFRPQTTE